MSVWNNVTNFFASLSDKANASPPKAQVEMTVDSLVAQVPYATAHFEDVDWAELNGALCKYYKNHSSSAWDSWDKLDADARNLLSPLLTSRTWNI